MGPKAMPNETKCLCLSIDPNLLYPLVATPPSMPLVAQMDNHMLH